MPQSQELKLESSNGTKTTWSQKYLIRYVWYVLYFIKGYTRNVKSPNFMMTHVETSWTLQSKWLRVKKSPLRKVIIKYPWKRENYYLSREEREREISIWNSIIMYIFWVKSLRTCLSKFGIILFMDKKSCVWVCVIQWANSKFSIRKFHLGKLTK